MTGEPSADSLANRPYDPADGAALDPRCLEVARALCIDKSTNSLRWVVDGKVRSAVDVRFGSAELPTREGVFSVYRKSRDHVSSLYDTSMPFAMFFSGGPGGPLLPRLRRQRLQRGLARVRQRARLLDDRGVVRPGAARDPRRRALVLTA